MTVIKWCLTGLIAGTFMVVSCAPTDNTTGNISGTVPNVSTGANVTVPSENETRGATVDLVARGLTFDKETITVNAGETVTINFDNRDQGEVHNFAVYNDSAAAAPAIFQGEIITGQNKKTYTFTAPTTPGTYFFRCDTHPATMTGSFVVR